MKTPEPDPNVAPKICAKPGCTTPLGPKNKSGKCGPHFHWTAPAEQSSSAAAKTNGHAHAPGNGVTAKTNGVQKTGNGVGKGANGHALEVHQDVVTPKNGSNGAAAVLPDLAPDRVNELLAALTAGDKARLLLAYLRGTV